MTGPQGIQGTAGEGTTFIHHTTAFVDPSGDDSGAVLGDKQKPYNTIKQAISAAKTRADNDDGFYTIIVYPGLYSESGQITLEDHNGTIKFIGQVYVEYDAASNPTSFIRVINSNFNFIGDDRGSVGAVALGPSNYSGAKIAVSDKFDEVVNLFDIRNSNVKFSNITIDLDVLGRFRVDYKNPGSSSRVEFDNCRMRAITYPNIEIVDAGNFDEEFTKLPDILIRDSILASAAGPNIGYHAFTKAIGKKDSTLLIKNSIIYQDPTYLGGGKTPIVPGFPLEGGGKGTPIDSHIFTTLNDTPQLRLILTESNFHTNGWSPPTEGSGDPEACIHYDNSAQTIYTEITGTYTNVRNYLGSATRADLVNAISVTKETKSPIEYMNII